MSVLMVWAAVVAGPVHGTGRWTSGWLNIGRQEHSATLLTDGRVLIVGGESQNARRRVEIFDPATRSWTLLPEQTSHSRTSHTATQLSDGRVLVAGGSGFSGRSSFELYDPTTGVWSMPPASLNEGRGNHTATLLRDGRVLVVGGYDGFDSAYRASSELFDPGAGSWSFSPTALTDERDGHTATLLLDGRVLVAGGFNLNDFELSSAEVYDPVTGVWAVVGSLATARNGHSATLLADGRVLVAGGFNGSFISSSEVFDPATGTWSPTSNVLAVGRSGHAAALLPDGRVLVAGGVGGPFPAEPLTSVEVFDPATLTWTLSSAALLQARSGATTTVLPNGSVVVAGGSPDLVASGSLATFETFVQDEGAWALPAQTLNVDRNLHTATLLTDGRVLVVGGQDGSTSFELFDPATGLWTQPPQSLGEGRVDHTATLLRDGRVLVRSNNSFEIFDPVSGLWSLGGMVLAESQSAHTATLLSDGRVLVAGGFGGQSHEIFDPTTGTWDEQASTLNCTHRRGTATLLDDGRMLLVGGETFSPCSLASVELFDPSTEAWSLSPDDLSQGRFGHTATRLHDGRVLVAGGFMGPLDSDALASFEIFDPSTMTWSASTESLNQARGGHKAVLLPDGRVLIAGGEGPGAGGGALASVEVFDPGTGRWTEIAPLQQDRATHTATLLLDGRVLVTGGFGTFASENRFELLTPLPVASARRPLVTATTAASAGDPFEVTGTGFRGDSEAGDGSTGSSNVNYPVTTLRSIEGDRVFRLVPGPLSTFSDDPMTLSFTLPGDLDVGQYRLSVATAGVPSISYPVEVGCAGNLSVTDPIDAVVPVGEAATFSVDSIGGRYYQWESCATGVCDPGDWSPIPGADGPSHTTDLVTGPDSGTKYRVEVRSSCGLSTALCPDLPGSCVRSAPALLTVEDLVAPTAAVESPSGGEYWLLSDPGDDGIPGTADDPPPNTELVTWSMSDDIRVCQVDVSLRASDDGGSTWSEVVGCDLPGGCGLPVSFGSGPGCVHPGEPTTSTFYTVPTTPPSGSSGSLYKIHVEVTDHAGNVLPVDPSCLDELGTARTAACSAGPFFMVAPDPDSVKTLLVTHSDRFDCAIEGVCDGSGSGGAGDQVLSGLGLLAGHPRVQGFVVDLANRVELGVLYDAWDAAADDVRNAPGDPSAALLAAAGEAANRVLFGCKGDPLPVACQGLVDPPPAPQELDGVHDVLLELLEAFPGVEYLVLAGDDRIVPFARLSDRTDAFPETSYPAGGDVSNKDTTVGQALAGDFYLSDDPLSVRDPLVGSPSSYVSVPDLATGRLVETPAEISIVVSTFISEDGGLELTDVAGDHRVLVSGYDFLTDSAVGIRRTWANLLGVPLAPPPDWSTLTAPLNGALVEDWPVVGLEGALREHLYGLVDGGVPYGAASLNGHANHYELGVPSGDVTVVEGLDALDLFGPDTCGNVPPLPAQDLAGRIVYAVGCHGGLPVPGSCFADRTLDLPQTFLARKVQAYLANSGYGWGFDAGSGYSERLVELFTSELLQGGSVSAGEAMVRAKVRYFQQKGLGGLDAYDEKTLQQWTLYGLPMYSLTTSAARSTGSGWDEPARSPEPGEELEEVDGVRVRRELAASRALPAHLTKLDLEFDFGAEGVYRKLSATGEELCVGLDDPGCPVGCPDPGGCSWSLNGLTSGFAEQPLQPYFVYDSRLANTSQHGVLWRGGTYLEETDWTPIIGVLVSNNGPTVPPEGNTSPRTRSIRSFAPQIVLGEDPAECAPSDLELNSVAVTTGESLVDPDDDMLWSQRVFETMAFEAFYFSNSTDFDGNCDRLPPVIGSPLPECDDDGRYHCQSGPILEWAVPVLDADDPDDGDTDPDSPIWRVVVVYTDNTVDGTGRGEYELLELENDGSDVWRGSVVAPPGLLTYVIQAVDSRGNLRWLEWEWPVVPPSGLTPPIPDPVDVDVQPGIADLSVAVTDAPDPVLAGSPLAYTIDVTNLGPDTAADVVVEDILPAGLAYALAGGDGWSCGEAAGTVTCTRPLLPVGPAPTITLFTTPGIPGPLTNSLTVSATTIDVEPVNDLTIVATTVQSTETLTVSHAGSGTGAVTSIPAGIDCGSTCAAPFLTGTQVTLSASPDPGSLFTGWSGDCTGTGSCVVLLDQPRAVTATFDLEPPGFELTVSLAGSGSGTVTSSPPGIDCSPDCDEIFPDSTLVTLDSVSDPGSLFTGWSGACGGTGPCQLTMDVARAVTATFEASQSLVVGRRGSGRGTVDLAPPGADCGTDCYAYAEGTSVDLTALPEGSASFVRWDGDCAGSGPVCNLQMTQPRTATAVLSNCLDDLEAYTGTWLGTTGPDDTGTTPWAVVSSDSHSPVLSLFVADLAQVEDQRIEMTEAVSILGPGAQLRFWHRFDTESGFDGGVLEYSVDDGNTWHDVLDEDGATIPANPARFLAGAYNGTLDTCCQNPLLGRDAWTGGNVIWEEVAIELSDFVGTAVLFRWRFGADDSLVGVGWWVDDVELRVAASCPFGRIFEDDLETGDTSEWSSTSP